MSYPCIWDFAGFNMRLQDVTHETLALVLKCASACRLVLPRRFEDVPLWIPEPNEASGGLPYRAGAANLDASILKWILFNRPRGEAALSANETRRLPHRGGRGASVLVWSWTCRRRCSSSSRTSFYQQLVFLCISSPSIRRTARFGGL